MQEVLVASASRQHGFKVNCKHSQIQYKETTLWGNMVDYNTILENEKLTVCTVCNTEYQDELIHVISECTCTVRQRDRFKNHILPSYDMSLAQNLNSVDTYTWALTLL